MELGAGDNKEQAIGELNGLNIEGRAINVSEARPQEFRGGVVLVAAEEDFRVGGRDAIIGDTNKPRIEIIKPLSLRL